MPTPLALGFDVQVVELLAVMQRQKLQAAGASNSQRCRGRGRVDAAMVRASHAFSRPEVVLEWCLAVDQRLIS